MSRQFQPGDDLLFQLESGYGLLRILAIDEIEGEIIWHLCAYENLFLESEAAEKSLKDGTSLKISIAHMALTNRAFERTPTAKLHHRELTSEEIARIEKWKSDPQREVSDRSALLMLGLR